MLKHPVCHIIGGGISGAACAYFLKMMNPDIYSVIYEAKEFLGGRSYSQYDDEWKMYLNNSAHVVLSSDKFMRKFVQDDEWRQNIFFLNMANMNGNTSIADNMDIITKKICNLKNEQVADRINKFIEKTFKLPKFKSPHFYSFNNDLNQRVINVLAAYADEVHCSCKLTKIIFRSDRVNTLCFGNRKVKLDKDDKVIVAVDNVTSAELLGFPKLEQTSSVSISYYTSQTVFLPQGVSFVGIKGGVTDWITTSSNVITAQICDYDSQFATLDKLAIHVWGEVSQVRGVNSAFMPSYRVELNKNMSIKMDEKNNNLRPDNAKTKYSNVFICGDWTMKNYPCTLETAVMSGRRAVKTMLVS